MKKTILKNSPSFLMIFAAVSTLILKFSAYFLSDSVGLLSDASESFINLTAAFAAWFALSYAAKPADGNHPYGHEKIEFFSSGLEGAMIIFASILIFIESTQRFLHPQPIHSIDLSLVLAIIAAMINFVVARILRKAALERDSIIMEASSKHLMSDVWTSLGVVVGLAIYHWTRLNWIDPVLGFIIGGQIIWLGFQLVSRAFHGLMDAALPQEEIDKIEKIIKNFLQINTQYHALRTRKSGARRFIDFHLLLPGQTDLAKSHDMADKLEAEIERHFDQIDITIHLEPLEDPKSWKKTA